LVLSAERCGVRIAGFSDVCFFEQMMLCPPLFFYSSNSTFALRCDPFDAPKILMNTSGKFCTCYRRCFPGHHAPITSMRAGYDKLAYSWEYSHAWQHGHEAGLRPNNCSQPNYRPEFQESAIVLQTLCFRLYVSFSPHRRLLIQFLSNH
jgi:hypothetical protein